jgi:hypothetical protein
VRNDETPVAVRPDRSAGEGRLHAIDALRGLMLMLMATTHLPTRFANPFGQPFGFVSAAEGFVLLSGFMAGLVYTRRAQQQGEASMQQAFLKRALKIYACQFGLLLFLFTVIAALGFLFDQPAVKNLVHFYAEHPGVAMLAGLFLVYTPPLLDILPMYVLFMLASPVLLTHALHQGWRGLLAFSVLMWLGDQFNVGHWLYDRIVDMTGLPVPWDDTGSFQLFAWQFVWVLGLWMGSSMALTGSPATEGRPFPRWMVATAWVYGGICMVWRHAVGQVPFGAHEALNMLQDKWQVGPMRLLNLFALLVLALHHGPALVKRLPRLRTLETWGSASLPVFCAHLVLALLALVAVGESTPERPVLLDVLILAGSFALMNLVAHASVAIDRRTAAMRQQLKERTREKVAEPLRERVSALRRCK